MIWYREYLFADDDVIRTISSNFVPVFVNLVKIRTDPDTKDWFRLIGSQYDQYQGIWVVSSEGKVLHSDRRWRSRAANATNLEFNNMVKQDMLEIAQASLKTFGPVQPRQVKPQEPLPYRGIGVRPDGNVDLAIYRRKVSPPSHRDFKADGPGMRDTLPLNKEEWAALTPPKPAAGTEWVIPEAIAKKMVRPLCINSLGSPASMPGPEDAKVAQLTARVEAVEDGQARIRLTGAFEANKVLKNEPGLSYRGAATATGIAVYDLNQKTMSSLLLVYHGTYQQGRTPESAPSLGLGAVIEWQREGTPPR